MADYVLEGPRWGAGARGTSGGTVTWAIDAALPAAFASVIQSAFATWASVANISFQQVASTATANIDLTQGAIDGLGNTLGYASYNFSGQRMSAATVTFDSAEGWRASGSKIVSNQGTDFYLVALHEIGHALGLDHYNGKPEVMNSIISPAITGLMAGDIAGIQVLYGPAPAAPPVSTVTPPAPINPTPSVARLYYGILDRAPDANGLSAWTDAVRHGMALTDVARAFLASTEYEVSTTGLTDAQFVESLYHQILGRAGEGAGVQTWTSTLDRGLTRGAVANAFADSFEFQSKYVGMSNEAYVDGLYHAVLGRPHDASGLQAWVKVLDGGMSRTDVAHAFTGSAEFQQKFVGPTDAGFVDKLYMDALGRHADAAGLQNWTSALAHGAGRGEVALGITDSTEAQQHFATIAAQGWLVT